MTSTRHAPCATEERARWLASTGQQRRAVTLLIQVHGPELRRFLRAQDPVSADDAYAELCLDFWRHFDGFGWRCSARSYLYVLAKNALARTQKATRRRAVRERRYAETFWFGVQRQANPPMHLRPETHRRLHDALATLSDDERRLFHLRVEQRLSYRDVARLMTGHEAKGAARMRKRFQVVKSKIERALRGSVSCV